MDMHTMSATTAMPAATTAIAMAHSHGMSMGDSGGGGGSGSSSSTGDGEGMRMDMSTMSMTFFQSASTPLLADGWSPRSTGQYVGTCLFIAALAALLRVMLAARSVIQRRIWRGSSSGGGGSFGPIGGEGGRGAARLLGDDPEAPPGKSYGSDVAPAAANALGRTAASWWRASRLPARLAQGSYELVIAAVGYLLMLAVMTMNVGYFLSVLGGVFAGVVLLGQSATHLDFSDHSC